MRTTKKYAPISRWSAKVTAMYTVVSYWPSTLCATAPRRRLCPLFDGRWTAFSSRLETAWSGRSRRLSLPRPRSDCQRPDSPRPHARRPARVVEHGQQYTICVARLSSPVPYPRLPAHDLGGRNAASRSPQMPTLVVGHGGRLKRNEPALVRPGSCSRGRTRQRPTSAFRHGRRRAPGRHTCRCRPSAARR